MEEELDRERLLDSMRKLKWKIEDKALTQFDEDDQTNLEPSLKELKYLGKIDLTQNIDGEEISSTQDIFLAIEEIDGHIIRKIYTRDMDCLAVYDDDFAILPEKDYLDNKYLIEQIETKDMDGIVTVEQLEDERLELLAKSLGIKVEDLKKIEEIDLNKDIDKQLEEDEDELDEEKSKKLIHGKQEIDLDTKVDDKHDLGSKLDLNSLEDTSNSKYTKLVVVETDDINDITGGEQSGQRTRYSFVALRADGTARVVNDVLELDKSSGANPSKESIKADANGTVRKDNQTLSRYKINGRDEYLSLENGQYGEIKAYYGKGKTLDGNINIETQLETTNVRPTPIEIRQLQQDEKGRYNNDKILDEAKECFARGEDKTTLENADGDEATKGHFHVDEGYLQMQAERIYESNQDINETFTIREIKDKLNREIEKRQEIQPIEEIIDGAQKELEQDAQRFQTRGERQ